MALKDGKISCAETSAAAVVAAQRGQGFTVNKQPSPRQLAAAIRALHAPCPLPTAALPISVLSVLSARPWRSKQQWQQRSGCF
ncbi:hypothetical protein CGLO_17933 [Colletotrichum gloeosporioides Cg-14]|uniref:Uncharacterized protein n=1 Tax=Colletotrichum gloeosporioides (strain Cg-14) TaxID=1237896 RepID=T0KVQ6_COLGC|nr:hypothetical protein CGLO_17933 [Colletotrichum gloeosporioides Cg-14]